MELRHIRYFIAVAEEGNMTKAADKLMIAQPPLSRQIKDLEEELGTPLFIRKSKGLQLTEAGNRFLLYAYQIVQLADQSVEDISEMSSGLRGTLFIATVEGSAPRILAEWIEGFHKKYPMVEFSLWNGNSDDVSNRVNSGLSDLAIITAPYDQERLKGIEVLREPWIAMIPEDSELAKLPGNTIKLKELADQDLLIPSRESRKLEIERWFAPLNIQPKVIGRLAHMLNAYELSHRGVGISIFPEGAMTYAHKGVVIKDIVEPDVIASYVFVRSNERTISTVAEEFWEYVQNTIKSTKNDVDTTESV